MKNIKIKMMLLLATIVTFSCAVDDDAAVVNNVVTKTVSISPTGVVLVPSAQGTQAVSFNVSDGGFMNDALVELTRNGEVATVTIAGGSSVSAEDYTVNTGDVIELQVNDVSAINASVNDELATVDTENNAVTLIGFDVNPVAGQVVFDLLWGDAFFDYDIFLVTGDQDLGGTVLDSSQGVTNSEQIAFDETQPDGVYSIYINDFWNDNAGTAVTFIATLPDGSTEVFLSNVDLDYWIITFEKTTNGTDVSYTFTQL